MPDDLEDDWASLGRGPGKVERAVRRAKEGSEGFVYDFLNFVFTWIGRAWNGFWGTLLSPALGATVVGLCFIVMIGYCFLQISKADGKVTFCTISQLGDEYKLMGHRDWRIDVTIMQKSSREPLLKAAQEQNCPLH